MASMDDAEFKARMAYIQKQILTVVSRDLENAAWVLKEFTEKGVSLADVWDAMSPESRRLLESARYYDSADGSLKELSPGVCALSCSECDGSWLRRVKPIYDLLKSGQVGYCCPNASCKWSSAYGSKMAVRRQDFGIETKSREQGDVPVWEVRFP